MREEDLKFHMRDDFYRDRTDIFIGCKIDGKRYVGRITWEYHNDGDYTDPTLSAPLAGDLADQVKQSLKAMGRLHFADEATLEAKDAHLEDMRRLVFEDKKA